MRCAVLSALLIAGPVELVTAAEPPPSPGASCQSAIQDAERNAKLPAGLLPAIGRVESGRVDPKTGRVQSWPWTINAEGVGQYFDTKEEAIGAVEALQARGVRSIDVGCMQVNLLHHPAAFPNLDAAFDPEANAGYAGRFLSALYGQAASWPVAAGFYHSLTPELADGYRRAVMLAWGRPDLAGPALGRPPSPSALAPIEQAAYRDFASAPRSAYAAFASPQAVYGAFTQPPARGLLPATRVAPGRRGPEPPLSAVRVRIASAR